MKDEGGAVIKKDKAFRAELLIENAGIACRRSAFRDYGIVARRPVNTDS
ncbi:MAG: hypothetical protein LUI87_18650 [Lachnospiraceae bacterium]|nr:hypothetical protein [Lachnospiraceae bacterium]